MQTSSTPTLLSTTLRASAEYSVPVQLDLKDGSTERVPAFIRRVKSGFFQLSTPVFLQQDTRIDMVSGKHTFEIEVVFCISDDRGRYSAGVRPMPGFGEGIRREPRFPVFLSAQVRSPVAPGPIQARVLDMSRSGLGIRVPISIPVGTGVLVELKNGTAFGEVKRCVKRTQSQWHLGVWLEEFVAQGDTRMRHTKAAARSDESAVMQTLKGMFDGQKKAAPIDPTMVG